MTLASKPSINRDGKRTISNLQPGDVSRRSRAMNPKIQLRSNDPFKPGVGYRPRSSSKAAPCVPQTLTSD